MMTRKRAGRKNVHPDNVSEMRRLLTVVVGRKIEIAFIKDKSRRHITFSKRKAGIMKKVQNPVLCSWFGG